MHSTCQSLSHELKISLLGADSCLEAVIGYLHSKIAAHGAGLTLRFAVSAVVFVTLFAAALAFRTAIRNGVKDSTRRTQRSLERARVEQNLHDAVALSWISTDAAFAAAIHRAGQAHLPSVMRRNAGSSVRKYARRARDLFRCDLVAVTDRCGHLLVALPAVPVHALIAATRGRAGSGLWDVAGTSYAVTTTPIRYHGRIAGAITTASRFDYCGFDAIGPVALLHDGRIVRSSFSPAALSEIPALPPECAHAGCELFLHGNEYLATPIAREAAGLTLGDKDLLLSFRSLDEATGNFNRYFRFTLFAAGLAVALSLVFLMIPAFESHPDNGWQEQDAEGSSELNRLALSIDRAAGEPAYCCDDLARASIQFVETMAQVLDARDSHTAGHSNRVSEYSTAIATTMGLSLAEIETIRLGAQLHDIGKIGIPDAVLQKNGSLSPEEYKIIQQHPRIGRRILEHTPQFKDTCPSSSCTTKTWMEEVIPMG